MCSKGIFIALFGGPPCKFRFFKIPLIYCYQDDDDDDNDNDDDDYEDDDDHNDLG